MKKTNGMKNQMEKVTTDDITGVRYLRYMDSFSVKVYVTKNKEKDSLEFQGFASREDARQFYKELKQSNNQNGQT